MFLSVLGGCNSRDGNADCFIPSIRLGGGLTGSLRLKAAADVSRRVVSNVLHPAKSCFKCFTILSRAKLLRVFTSVSLREHSDGMESLRGNVMASSVMSVSVCGRRRPAAIGCRLGAYTCGKDGRSIAGSKPLVGRFVYIINTNVCSDGFNYFQINLRKSVRMGR